MSNPQPHPMPPPALLLKVWAVKDKRLGVLDLYATKALALDAALALTLQDDDWNVDVEEMTVNYE